MTSGGSISFERAAGFYDKTRALSPGATKRITGLLEAELRDRGATLEVGVGTGRIALPLAERGIDLFGLDLARNMLDRLVHNAGGESPFPLVQGDATRLPFEDRSFDAGIASWVLHLVPAWREVVGELLRVIGDEGVVLVDAGSQQDSITTAMTWRFKELAGITDWPPGAQGREEVLEHFSALGARPRALQPIRDVTKMALAEHIDLLERGVYSVTWGVDESTRRETAAQLRRWTESEFGSISEPRDVETIYVWHAFDL